MNSRFRLYIKAIQDINNGHHSISEILSKFYAENVRELSDYLTNIFTEDFNELIKINYYASMYHEFLYNLVEAIDSIDDLQYLSICIGKHINTIKEEIKPYNKKEKEKGELYTKIIRFRDDLLNNQSYADNKCFNLYEDDKVKLLKHIIFDLKDLDALNYLLTNHGEIVNVYINDEDPFIFIIIRHFCDNVSKFTDTELDYYKRVITMFLLRDELKLSLTELNDIRGELNYNLTKNSEHKRHIEFILYMFKKRDNREIIDGTIQNEVIIPKNLLDGRMDIRSLPTISIDYVKYPDGVNMLHDDAFSFQEKEDGTYYLWMHIPDVDEYIPRDGELDKYMHANCESIYIKGNKEPMLPYNLAKKISLVKNEERLALSFRMHVDEDGNILGINYYKTVIKVDGNYSKSQADLLMKMEDYSYKKMLNKMAIICKKLRNKRKETIGSRTKAGIIMDEYNIWSNISTAMFCDKNNILFPYKCFMGDDYSNKYINDMRAFLLSNHIDEDSRNLLYELVDAKSRNFYSTTNYGNAHFNKMAYGNVGNPLREYISLETDRLIKDLIIDELDNLDYWTERIENDCVELSEMSSKVKELYKTRS